MDDDVLPGLTQVLDALRNMGKEPLVEIVEGWAEELMSAREREGKFNNEQAVSRICEKLGLAPVPAWLIYRLWLAQGRVVETRWIHENAPGRVPPNEAHYGRVPQLVLKVRTKVGHDMIETVHGRGFRLGADGYEMLDDILKGDDDG